MILLVQHLIVIVSFSITFILTSWTIFNQHHVLILNLGKCGWNSNGRIRSLISSLHHKLLCSFFCILSSHSTSIVLSSIIPIALLIILSLSLSIYHSLSITSITLYLSHLSLSIYHSLSITLYLSLSIYLSIHLSLD